MPLVDLLRAQAFQPVSQVKSRFDVLTVVGFDDHTRVGEDGSWITRFQRHLDRNSVGGRHAQGRLTHIAVVLLEFLDGVALDTCSNGLAHDGVQIDQTFVSQQLVQRVLTSRVAPSEPLERRRFVWREMIDVEAGFSRPRGGYRVDQLLERVLLFERVQSPPGTIGDLSSSFTWPRPNR